MTKFIIMHLLILSTAITAQAHGGDKPGPHGGFIQMPANFHTEVIVEKDQSVKVYLLDIEFKNPLTTKSAVKAWVVENKKRSDLQCKAESDYFVCHGTKPLKAGTLFLSTTRDGVVAGMNASYDLPLKREGK